MSSTCSFYICAISLSREGSKLKWWWAENGNQLPKKGLTPIKTFKKKFDPPLKAK